MDEFMGYLFTNLMFADDSLLFCRATQDEVEVINEVL